MLIHWINWREFVWIVNFQLPRIPPISPPMLYKIERSHRNLNLRLAVCETNKKQYQKEHNFHQLTIKLHHSPFNSLLY